MKKQKLTLKRIKHLAGFTLVEVLIVSVIVALIASITVPSLVGYISKARLDSEISDAERALAAVETELTELYNTSDDGEINCVYEGLNVTTDNQRVTQAIEKDNPYYNQLFYGVQEITGIDSLYTFVVGLGDYSTYSKDDIDKAYTPYIAYYQATASSTMLYYDGSSWEEAENKTIGNEIVSLADGTRIQLYDIYYEGDGPADYIATIATTTTKITTVTTTTTTTVAATEDEDEEEPTTEAVTDNGLAKAKQAKALVDNLLSELSQKKIEIWATKDYLLARKRNSIFGENGVSYDTKNGRYWEVTCAQTNDDDWTWFNEKFIERWKVLYGYTETPYIMTMCLGYYNQYVTTNENNGDKGTWSWEKPYHCYVFCFMDTETSKPWFFVDAIDPYKGWYDSYPWFNTNICTSSKAGGTFKTSDPNTSEGNNITTREVERYIVYNANNVDVWTKLKDNASTNYNVYST